MNAKCGGDYRVCGCDYDGNVHEVEEYAIADGKAFMPSGKFNALPSCKSASRETIIEHRESIVVTFHEHGDDGSDPSYDWDQRKKNQPCEIERLPKAIPQCEFCASSCIAQYVARSEGRFTSFDDRFRLLTQVGEKRRANDHPDVFEEGEVEEHEREPEHDSGEGEEKTKQAVFEALQPVVEVCDFSEVFDDAGGRLAKEIDAHHEHRSVDYAGNEDPFPKPVLHDELVRL